MISSVSVRGVQQMQRNQMTSLSEDTYARKRNVLDQCNQKMVRFLNVVVNVEMSTDDTLICSKCGQQEQLKTYIDSENSALNHQTQVHFSMKCFCDVHCQGNHCSWFR